MLKHTQTRLLTSFFTSGKGSVASEDATCMQMSKDASVSDFGLVADYPILKYHCHKFTNFKSYFF